MHGAPALPPGFANLPHVNPTAPKGGRLTQGILGSFDSLNAFIIKGQPAEGLREFVFESLMARAPGEPFSLYGLLAERLETPPDRASVTFTLRAEARFSDGKPVRAEDILFSHRLLKDKGPPYLRGHYSKVATVEKTGEREVTFTFKQTGDREIPLIVGLMPILPSHRVNTATFETTSLEPPTGSGPYVVATVEAGKQITFRRNPDYWGRDLAINKGRHNFDELRFEYFRDANTLFEAFKTGVIDFRVEDDAKRWARNYDFPALRDGRVVKTEFKTGLPSGMRGFVFNTRRPMFADARVRRAIGLLFDFEWANRNLYYGLYTRTQSYFDGSALSSHGRPANAVERALLAAFPAAVSVQALDGISAFPVNDGSGHDRDTLKAALDLLDQAGWTVQSGRLLNKASRQPFRFEILAETSAQERRMLGFARSLKLVGIEVAIRQVDTAQFWNRTKAFDFDMTEFRWSASLSPGNEQINRWGSAAADRQASLNYAGVKNPAADAMIEAMLSADSREDFEAAVRALDRVLISGNYVVPLFHPGQIWVAHWRRLRHPSEAPLAGLDLPAWWSAQEDK